MTELILKRWTRYGKDRLYVNLPDGQRVGWMDLQTGEATLDLEEWRAEFEAALADRRRQTAPDGAARTGPPETSSPPTVGDATSDVAPVPPRAAEPEPFAIEITWRDLAANKAGQQTRQQAVRERRAAPVRSTLARLLGVHTDERAWRIGADGEERVAARLDRLHDGWQVLHALPVGNRGADIDHLVVGPGGVFTINAKHHPDARVWVGGSAFMVNGRRYPYVRNSRHEAARAARLLSAAVGWQVTATGVIAVVGAHKGFTVKEQPDGVHVVTRKRLARWLLGRPRMLDEEQVAAIFAASRRSDTWQ